jgi:hypothetical protein
MRSKDCAALSLQLGAVAAVAGKLFADVTKKRLLAKILGRKQGITNATIERDLVAYWPISPTAKIGLMPTRSCRCLKATEEKRRPIVCPSAGAYRTGNRLCARA